MYKYFSIALLMYLANFCNPNYKKDSSTPIILKNLNTNKSLNGSYFKHLEGYINDRPAAMELLNRDINDELPLFYAFYYFLDEKKPLLIQGKFQTQTQEVIHHLDTIGHIKSSTILEPADNNDIIELTDPKIITITGCHNSKFKGRFVTSDTFIGDFYDCSNKKVIFKFTDKQNVNYELKPFSYKNEFKLTNNTIDNNAFLTVETLIPDGKTALDSLIMNFILKIMAIDGSFKFNIKDSIRLNIEDNKFNYFKNDKDVLSRFPATESYHYYHLFIPYRNKKLISFLSTEESDVARKNQASSVGYSFDLGKKQQLTFENIFKRNSKLFIYTFIKNNFKATYNKLEKFNEHNFYLTDAGIVFINFTDMDSHEHNILGTQYFIRFNQLTEFLKPDFKINE